MKRRDALRSMAMSPLAGHLGLTVAGSAAAPTDVVATYRTAFDKLPTLTPAEKALLDDAAVAPLDRATSDLVDRAAPALELLDRAASAASCDWGKTWVGDGFEHVTDWIMKGRSLGRLAALRARIAIESGRSARGIDDAIAALTFGRHLGQGGAMIAQLIGMAIEHDTINATAVPLPRLDRAGLRTLDARLLGLPRIVDLPSTIRAEREFYFGYYLPHNPDDADPAKVKPLTVWYDRMVVACTDPSALDVLRSEAQAEAEKKQFFESFDSFVQGRIYADVKRALFRAAIAVAGDGPGAVGRVLDPFDGEPFRLRTWSTGFELTSRFVPYKKPNAVLLVGKRS